MLLIDTIGEKGKETLVTSSRKVAEVFEKEHSKIIRSIENLNEAKNGLVGKMFYETTYVDAKREKRKEYLMNRDGFSLLVMGFTGEKALEFKLNYIEAFNQMEEMLKERNNEHHRAEVERIKGIGIRRALTDTICKLVADTPHKKFAYANYTKLIYKVTFGLTMDELRSKYGATTKESVRDLMSAEDLLAVQNKEFLVSGLIAEGWSYKEIRSFMETHCHKADDFHIDVAKSIENKAAKELC